MFIINTTSHNDIKNSPRNRRLTRWEIIRKSARDPNITMYCLSGRVVLENDGFHPPARWTQTSPIASCVRNVVVTASGSIYHLDDKPLASTKIYSPDQYIADRFLNPWIDGDNWMTI